MRWPFAAALLLALASRLVRALATSAPAASGRLILVRHGQSTWNELGLFTGWADPPLTAQGRREAAHAGALLGAYGVRVDTALCSTLRRTSQSLETMLATLNQQPAVVRSWRLNEQHCGALTGWNKRELAIAYGERQVRRWRREPHVRPPPASELLSERVVQLGARIGRLEQRRSCSLTAPSCESMLDACSRYRPLWSHLIAPLVRRGQTVLVVGHGNMLRGAVREIEGLSDEQLMALEIPQATPMMYHFDADMRPVEAFDELAHGGQAIQTDGIHGVLLGDPDAIRGAQELSAAAHTAQNAAPGSVLARAGLL
ncbi:hypothetical protein KFE25_008598 [Diacronema lutheri]|uniref:Phosphoglycerate mutase n=2 Tax=Diacronema lutheri TaxID=2081491 RepID=A0A8J5XX77_DIALT|nr:hypothetical protein KFE25_008598 [Diacronema lutheri]